jgi:hypothetical protein
MVAGKSRTWAGRTHAVSGRPTLIYTCHAMPMPRCAVALRSRFQKGMVMERERYRRGMAWRGMCESNTSLLCKSNRKDTILNLKGTAWERHGMCELALSLLKHGYGTRLRSCSVLTWNSVMSVCKQRTRSSIWILKNLNVKQEYLKSCGFSGYEQALKNRKIQRNRKSILTKYM